MGKLSGILVTFVGIAILMIGFRPAYDIMFETMNTTGSGLSNIESMVWRFAPVAIPIAAVVGGIIVLGRRRDNRREGTTQWRDR